MASSMRCAYCGGTYPWPDDFPDNNFAECWRCCVPIIRGERWNLRCIFRGHQWGESEKLPQPHLWTSECLRCGATKTATRP